ncbi:class I SAM-dependent methyltransferase [Nibricoccus sp. IMCC34717]|uniref:class I SAM-dependent methyltransferase n=1 Tax=Nibricoccus sp. IMCC34717 TaxID=3034021 RepID=UPI0038517EC1
MAKIETNFKISYTKHVQDLKRSDGRDTGLQKAIGGEFEAVGKLEYYLLRSLGLRDDSIVVDVGCGSGRLAYRLKEHRSLMYYGFDVVEDLLQYAAEISGRSDWLFKVTDGRSIPLPDKSADFICMFSVITHLLHEDSYRYFIEASRVLKPNGVFVCSFLEFSVPTHWPVFENSYRSTIDGEHLNQFASREAISAWADHSGLKVDSFRRGDEFHIPIPEEIVFENGDRQGCLGTFGQSVAVLSKSPS